MLVELSGSVLATRPQVLVLRCSASGARPMFMPGDPVAEHRDPGPAGDLAEQRRGGDAGQRGPVDAIFDGRAQAGVPALPYARRCDCDPDCLRSGEEQVDDGVGKQRQENSALLS